MKNCVPSSSRAQFRQGLTIVEVLVAVAVIGLILALLIPAVQQVRQRATAVSCLNQLRQITLAALIYESSWGVMPSGRWSEQLASHLEYSANDLHRDVRFPKLGCPMDRLDATGNIDHLSYMLNCEITNDQTTDRPGQLRWRPLANITDGLSNTAMFGEVLSYPREALGPINWATRKRDWKRTFMFLPGGVGPGFESFHRRCSEPELQPFHSWLHCTTYRHLMQPNQNSCFGMPNTDTSSNPSAYWIIDARTAGSPHSGGTHLGFCDGSARFVGNEIDLKVWWALGTRAGGEVISEF